MRSLNFLFTIVITFIFIFSIDLSAQDVIIKTQSGEKKITLNKDHGSKMNSKGYSNQINKKPLISGTGDSSSGWTIIEDFESAVFPPDEWSNIGWEQTGYSSYGNGSSSAYFCNYCCTQINNEFRTPYFLPTVTGDILTFDVAYAPGGDSINTITDYLYVACWDDDSAMFSTLFTYDKDSLATSPPTNAAFFPTVTQWKTISIDLPENVSQIYFSSLGYCGNNMFLDNIKVGQAPPPNPVFLSEDFSGSFPPADWNTGSYWIYNPVSAYGLGTGSIMRELINCNSTTNDFLITPVFSPSAPGTKLMFDYAYAPYGNFDFDNLEIYGTSDSGMNFTLITTMSGNPNGGELVTSPKNFSYFVPDNSEWASKIVNIPAGTTQLKFAVSIDCSNNLYLDNISIQDSLPGNSYYAEINLIVEGFYNEVYNSMTPDSVKLYLKNSVSPYSTIDSSAAVINISAAGIFSFNNVTNNIGYYILVKHRNSIETWSKTAQTFTNNTMTYDFTTDNTKAYGDNLIIVNNSPVKFAIYSGDVNQDGAIDLADVTDIENDAFNFASGYLETDVNGDRGVDIADQTIADNNAFNFVAKITP